MFLITVKNFNIILSVYLMKKLIINNVVYTSKGSGVYVIWGWRIRPMGVAYTSNGGGVYVQWTYTFKGPKNVLDKAIKHGMKRSLVRICSFRTLRPI